MAKAPFARRVAAACALAGHLRGGTPAGSGRTYRAEMRALAASPLVPKNRLRWFSGASPK